MRLLRGRSRFFKNDIVQAYPAVGDALGRPDFADYAACNYWDCCRIFMINDLLVGKLFVRY